MQKKWWKKPMILLGSTLIVGTLAFSSALAVVSCSNNQDSTPPPVTEEYVNNRPAKGFYYQYQDSDKIQMQMMIKYVYDNHPIKHKFIELGYRWPAITKIDFFVKNAHYGPIPGDVFTKEYEDYLDSYKDTFRVWKFKVYFEITDENIQKEEPNVEVWFNDWMYSFTSIKYINDTKLWKSQAPIRSMHWHKFVNTMDEQTWNAPLKFRNRYAALSEIFDAPSDYRYGNAVDSWYIINQWKPTWPKTREQYWEEMINTRSDPIDWDWILPIEE